ncbi:hypothetical protein T4D_12187 [Trichinella pseudospiralis]|uniref:Uncharacterized protein n=1 Tax=Trichinella pseudospiralis TaxID=6337 RepID=A0A0V1FNU6_TRIPS|nr:hypothetical protein T4D_12187 [Trichinella pseudospiralis]
MSTAPFDINLHSFNEQNIPLVRNNKSSILLFYTPLRTAKMIDLIRFSFEHLAIHFVVAYSLEKL